MNNFFNKAILFKLPQLLKRSSMRMVSSIDSIRKALTKKSNECNANYPVNVMSYRVFKHWLRLTSIFVTLLAVIFIYIDKQSDSSTLAHNIKTKYETATFGMGCFWSADSLFGGTYGVLRTQVGYSGGKKLNPKYRDLGDHVEVVRIDYDPDKITYEELLNLFWNNHEYGLTTRVKRQYMSLILYHNEEQKEYAMASIKRERVNRVPEIINTEIAIAGLFYAAEDHHQKYRLQGHKDFVKTLNLNSSLLLTSHVAAKLNGYLVGVGGLEQFDKEAPTLGLNTKQIEYVRHYLQANEGAGLYC